MNAIPSSIVRRCHVAATPVYVPPLMSSSGSPVNSA